MQPFGGFALPGMGNHENPHANSEMGPASMIRWKRQNLNRRRSEREEDMGELSHRPQVMGDRQEVTRLALERARSTGNRTSGVKRRSQTCMDETVETPETPVRDFTVADSMSNAVLVVEGKQLHVHKEMLGQWSSVMMQMFTSSFKEGNTCTVVLHGKTMEQITSLLSCLYPPNAQVTEANYLQLLQLADEYDIPLIKHKCCEVILSLDPGVDLIFLAHQYHLPQVVESLIEKCSNLPMSDIDYKVHEELAEHLPADIYADIYRLKIQSLISDKSELKRNSKKRQGAIQEITSWGSRRNSYPCDKHRTFNDTCIQCLTAFRTYALERVKDLK